MSLVFVCVSSKRDVTRAGRQLEQKKQAEKVKRDQLNDLHLDLVDKQRLYVKTVKEFQQVRIGTNRFASCRKNCCFYFFYLFIFVFSLQFFNTIDRFCSFMHLYLY